MKKFLLFLPLFFAVASTASAQHVEWAFNLGLPAGTTITTITATPAGDIYTAVNNKKGTILSQYPIGDLRLTRYDSTGAVVWVKTFPGKATVMAIEEDRQGNLIIGGGYMDTLVLDSLTLINPDLHRPDHFLAKMDPNGNFLWAKTEHTYQQTSYIANVAIDNSNAIYATGQATSLTGLFAKYDASGNRLWAKQIPDARTMSDVQVDSSGAIFVTGTCRPTTVFDNASVTMPTGTGYVIFLARYNQQPEAQWVAVWPYHTFDNSDGLLLRDKRLYWLHRQNKTGASGSRLVLQKYSLQGALLAETDSFPQILLDDMANRFIYTKQRQLAFSVARFDTARFVMLDTSLHQLRQFHFRSSNIKASVLSNFGRKIVCGGSFSGASVNIDTAVVYNANTPPHSSNNDNYLSVFSPDRPASPPPPPPLGLAAAQQPELRLYPNPVTGILHIEGAAARQAAVYDLAGRKLLQAPAGNVLDLRELPAGLYIVEISTGSTVQRKRVVKL